ncbi:hypothetical protein H5410_057011 [Solanum commersonii]|uniref:Uncharacterized protein n=1 Tax=Solanum commersonii TaxID=4109 RepID=A0A9J5WNF4_SOLCO|nr:hypothetical protein H5410_057011 [Solanum commersonii]
MLPHAVLQLPSQMMTCCQEADSIDSKIVKFNGPLSRCLRREWKRFPLNFHHLKETCRPILMMSNQFFTIFHVNVEKRDNHC